jgi:hypothetical protein
MLQVLQEGGAEIREAAKPFRADDVVYPAGTYFISLDQPYRAFIKDLLERKAYPIPPGTEGVKHLPYDEASWTLPLQMGVKTIAATAVVEAESRVLEKIDLPRFAILGTGSGRALIRNETNQEAILVNRLMRKGVAIHYADREFILNGRSFPAGTLAFPLKDFNRSALSKLAGDLGIEVSTGDGTPGIQLRPLKRPRIGVYQSWISNQDEGWLRWVLEQHEFPFKVIHNEEIKAGNLLSSYTHIILPSMTPEILLEGRLPGESPPEYTGGIGKEGISSLEEFARAGGRLIFLDKSADFAIRHLGLGVKNIVEMPSFEESQTSSSQANQGKEKIYCPGSLLETMIDNTHPVGYGLERNGVAFSYFSPVFVTEKEKIIVSYPNRNPLLSGILIGEDKLYGKAAAVEAGLGSGSVVLFGFDLIHRAQAQATFKLLFNALFY